MLKFKRKIFCYEFENKSNNFKFFIRNRKIYSFNNLFTQKLIILRTEMSRPKKKIQKKKKQ